MCIREPYRAYATQLDELCLCLETQGVTLHSGRNLIKKATIGDPGGESIDVAVKSFRVPARPRGLVYARLRPSKARRSLAYAVKLLDLGIATPDPVACIEYVSAGCLRESYYICRYRPPDIDLARLLYGSGSFGGEMDALLDALARFTLHQHASGVLHLDYNPGNILARSRGEGFDFALVDLNRLRFKSLGMDERISGLVRLTKSVDYLNIIGRHYAESWGVDAGEFCRKLERAHRRFTATRRIMNRVKSSFRHER